MFGTGLGGAQVTSLHFEQVTLVALNLLSGEAKMLDLCGGPDDAGFQFVHCNPPGESVRSGKVNGTGGGSRARAHVSGRITDLDMSPL